MERKKGVLSLLLIIFSFWVFLFIKGREHATAYELLLASGIYFSCCVPTIVYFLRKKPHIPYMPVFGLFYFIYFGLSTFINYKFFLLSYINIATIDQCLAFTLLGYISMMLAFYTPLTQAVQTVIKPLSITWDVSKAFRLGIFMGFIGNAIYYITLNKYIPIRFAGTINFLSEFSRLGIAMLFMMQLQGKLKFRGKVILWLGLFVPRVGLDLSTGFLFPVIFDFILLFFLIVNHIKAIPWLKLAITASVLLLMFSVKGNFRYLTWYGYSGYADSGEYAKSNAIEKAILYGRLMYEKLTGSAQEASQGFYEELGMRSDYLVTFTRVVELTPLHIPYWGGYTYRTLLTSFIPRIILPEKPQKTLGQDFGHRYMFLDPQDVSTSYNLPFVIEFYVNFGEWGIIIGMFIIGLIYRIFFILFNHEHAGEGGFLIGVMIFIALLNIEFDFSLIFGNIIQFIILFYFIVKRLRLSVRRVDAQI